MIERNHPLRHTPRLLYPEGYHDGNWRNHIGEQYMRHLDLFRRFKDIRRKELGSEIAGGSEDSQQTQPKTKNPIVSTGRPVKSEQPSGSLTQEINKGVLFGCESTNVSTERPLNSCVPVSVERLNNQKQHNPTHPPRAECDSCKWI